MTPLSVTMLLLLSGCGEPEPPPPLSLADLPALPEPAAESAVPRGVEREVVELRIALVGEVRGEIEPCGCPTLPYGGFTRRERLLKTLPGPLFHLDAGETLLEGFSARRADRGERAKLVMSLSKLVGVDAWAPGPSDLAAVGLDGLRDAPVPAISATWRDAAGAPLLSPWVVLEEEGVSLGVIGLSGALQDPDLRDTVMMRDPVEATREALSQLPEGLDLVVALGSITDEDAARVASVEGIAAVLTTRGREYDSPLRTTGGLVVEAPDRGRYVEVLHVRVGSEPGVPLRQLPEGRLWQELLTLRTQTSVATEPERQAVITAALAEREVMFEADGRGRNLVFVEHTPLSSALDGPAESAALLLEFKDETLVRAAETAARKTTPTEPGYASSGRCISCHSSEMARWVVTDHATAWQSLLTRQATDNPECIGCHSTGFGEPGGFGELTSVNVRKYKAVQCESCHGPMRGHPEDDAIHAVPVTEGTCVRCHDPANSPDFEFETYLRRGSCQQ
ncbi:MAG: hypothetical protein ACI8RZ_000002 [Myxococcota bacterium]|jgi:hypothetical protein